MAKSDGGGYGRIIEKIFFDHYEADVTEFVFHRREIVKAKEKLAPDLDLNPGDVPYRYRYRSTLPRRITATQPAGMEWIIEGAGRSKYRFRLVGTTHRVVPRSDLICIDIPDSTPELIRAYALDDEQALLAIVRYNRLIDIFLGLTTYSLQNHLRTYVADVGQIEVDELYIGIDKRGCHYVIPVQAKGGKDKLGIVQTTQDIRFAENKFPGLRCRAVAAQFLEHGVIALFELTLADGEIKVVDERHYRLVPADKLNQEALRKYRD